MKYRVFFEWRARVYVDLDEDADSEEAAIALATDEAYEDALANLTLYDASAKAVK